MRKNLISTLVISALVVTGTAIGITQADATTQPNRPSGIHLAASRMFGTVDTGYKPKTMYFSVDGAYKITNLHWKSWGSKKAVGYGTARVNNCVPDCSTSTSFQYLDVTVVVTQPKHNKFTMSDIESSSYPVNWVTRNK